MENLNFGDAIKALKEGKKVARKGWNGKGMFIFLHEGHKFYPSPLRSTHEVLTGSSLIRKIVNEREKEMDSLPFIVMKTADNKFCPGWLASQTDMLSEDWMIVE